MLLCYGQGEIKAIVTLSAVESDITMVEWLLHQHFYNTGLLQICLLNHTLVEMFSQACVGPVLIGLSIMRGWWNLQTDPSHIHHSLLTFSREGS